MSLIVPANFKTFIRDRLEQTEYTRDTPALYKKKKHVLFVYGTLKSGFSRSWMLESCPFIGVAYTKPKIYTMYRRVFPKSNYPVVFHSNNSEEMGAIYGEVYLVPPQKIIHLDFVEGNTVTYDRIFIPIDLIDKDGKRTVEPAWIYVGKQNAWKTFLSGQEKGLVRCERFTSNKDKSLSYYYYTKQFSPITKKSEQKCPDKNGAASATTTSERAPPF